MSNYNEEVFDDDLDLSNANILNFDNMGYQKLIMNGKKNKSYRGETVNGMTNVLPFVDMPFSNRTSMQIEQYYFPDAKKTKENNVSINYDVDTPQDLNIDPIVNQYFLDLNRNKVKDENEISYKIILFISKNKKKIEETYEKANPNKDEILLFIDYKTGDYSTEQVIYGKIAPELRNELIGLKKTINFKASSSDLNKYIDASQDVLTELINTGKIEGKSCIPDLIFNGIYHTFNSFFLVSYGVGYIIDLIGKGIALLKVPDSIWDTENKEYAFEKNNLKKSLTIDTKLLEDFEGILQKENDKLIINLIPDAIKFILEKTNPLIVEKIKRYNSLIEKTIDDYFESESYKKTSDHLNEMKFHEKLAFICGIYNGIIDFVASVISFIGDILKLPKAIFDNWDKIMETLGKIKDFFSEEEWFDKVYLALSLVFDKIIKYFKTNEKDDYNWVRIAYICGFALFFVVSLFIPYANIARALGTIGKVGKFGTLLADLLKGFQKGTATLAQAGKQGIRQMLQFINDFLLMFKTGGNKLIKFFEDIWKKFSEWFLKNKEKFKYIDDFDNFLEKFIRILLNNLTYKECIELVKKNRVLGKWISIELEAMIKLYTANAYIRLNKALRELINIDEELIAIQKVLDNALEKLPNSLYNKGILQRSAYFTEAEIKKLFIVGKDFVEKGFMSTTYSERALMQWLTDNPLHNVIIKVYGKNGKLIEDVSMLPFEHEVLFKSGTKFVVEGMKPIPNPVDRTKKVLEIILKEK
jgi:hypothetical protein